MLDPVGYPTIGWGSRYDLDGKEVTMKTKPITLGECDLLLARDVQAIGNYLNKYDLTQNQFDALTSFCYNIGLGGYQKSSLARAVALGGKVDEVLFTAYSKARNAKTGVLETLPGLLRRRKAEYALFSSYSQ